MKLLWVGVFSLFVVTVISILIIGFLGGAYDQDKCLESARVEFQGGHVHMIPNKKYSFIAEDESGNIYFVETDSRFSSKVTKKYLIIERKTVLDNR